MMSSAATRRAQSLVSLLSATTTRSALHPPAASCFPGGFAAGSDSPGYSGIHKIAGFLFLRMNTKAGICTPSRRFVHSSTSKDAEFDREQGLMSMNFVRNVLQEDNRQLAGDRRGGGVSSFMFPHNNIEQDVDFVHIKMLKNNTFVTVTDSKGNKKFGASSGCVKEMKGGSKGSRYASEATAEHVGRLCRNIGLKSVVVRVKGFTLFKKKKQAILSWRDGFTNNRAQRNPNSPIVYIEDVTRRPHNGCRRRKQRRI